MPPGSLPPGWGTDHHRGLRQGDCATYYDRALWRKTGSRVVRLTDAPFRAGTRYALITHLRGQGTTLAVVCVHMITKSLARRAVYAHGMDRLRSTLSGLTAAHVVVGGDWNRVWPQRAPLSGLPHPRSLRHRPAPVEAEWTTCGGRVLGSGQSGSSGTPRQTIRESGSVSGSGRGRPCARTGPPPTSSSSSSPGPSALSSCSWAGRCSCWNSGATTRPNWPGT